MIWKFRQLFLPLQWWGESLPLYKDFETWDESPGSLFCAVFVSMLSENKVSQIVTLS